MLCIFVPHEQDNFVVKKQQNSIRSKSIATSGAKSFLKKQSRQAYGDSESGSDSSNDEDNSSSSEDSSDKGNMIFSFRNNK